ncbi:hypothetical protein J4477_04925 [Candidatus Pacearchaeota archaeon]|nr:hypothetical protein [Candidatus Pacearchaeota archaeon]
MKRGAKKESIRFNPVLLKQGKNTEDEKDQQQYLLDESYYAELGKLKKKRCKDNIGRYYVELFASLYNGSVNPLFKSDLESYSFGNRKFRPDITERVSEGILDKEVKSFDKRSSKSFVSPKQLENYCHNLLQHLDQGLEMSHIEYGFFRYGGMSTRKVNFSTLSEQELKKHLSQSQREMTKDLLILPLNLLLFILSTRRYAYNTKTFNQSSSRGGLVEAKYWLLEGSDIRRLHQGPVSFAHFLKDSFNGKSREMFALDNIEIEQKSSPERLYCGKYKLAPFKITYYFLNPEGLKIWNSNFVLNHKSILEEIGIDDLHHKEEQTVRNNHKGITNEEWEELISGRDGRKDLSSLSLALSSQDVPF